MIGLILDVVRSAMRTRIGKVFLLALCGFAAGFGLWALHELDKSRAVKAARDGYVLQVELAEAQAELAELRRRAAVADEANRVLQEKVQASEGEALRFAAELEAYENETDINPDGVVSDDLLRRMRAN